jgi:hypothetical protein
MGCQLAAETGLRAAVVSGRSLLPSRGDLPAIAGLKYIQ